MGLFKKSVSKDLIKLVRSRDNGEEWAIKKLAELCSNETVTIRSLLALLLSMTCCGLKKILFMNSLASK